MMNKLLGVALLVAGLAPLMAQSSRIDPSLYGGLQWRLIGPFRGGRVNGVTGAIVLLIEGLQSGPMTPMTAKDWDEIKRKGEQSRHVRPRRARRDERR